MRCAARGGLPEGCALPWSWRAARASRRCARRCAGCSAAAGTRGWPSRCSGPFGAHQTEIRTAGDPWPCPGRGDARGRGSPRSGRARARRCHHGRARREPPAFPERGTGRVPEPTQPGPGCPVGGQHSPGATRSCCCFPALPLLPAPGSSACLSPMGQGNARGSAGGQRGSGEVPEGTALQARGRQPPGTWWQRRGGAHHPLAPLAPLQAHELLVLPRHEVDGGVLQQGGEDEEQADGHPDVDGLHVGDLRGDGGSETGVPPQPGTAAASPVPSSLGNTMPSFQRPSPAAARPETRGNVAGGFGLQSGFFPVFHSALGCRCCLQRS